MRTFSFSFTRIFVLLLILRFTVFQSQPIVTTLTADNSLWDPVDVFSEKSTHIDINKSKPKSQCISQLLHVRLGRVPEPLSLSVTPEKRHDSRSARGTRCCLRCDWHRVRVLWPWARFIPSPAAADCRLQTARVSLVLGRSGRVSGKRSLRDIWFPSAPVLILNFSWKISWHAGKCLCSCCFSILFKTMLWNSHFKPRKDDWHGD